MSKKEYTVQVTETREYTVSYIVEASSQTEACDMANNGETLEESKGILEAVIERQAIKWASSTGASGWAPTS